MGREVRAETELQASPEEVWDVVMDPGRLERWVTTHEGLEGDVPDRLEAGSTFRQRLKVGGAAFTVTWTVVECEHPRLVRWEGDGPAGSAAFVEYLLSASADGTRFAYSNRFELPGGVLGRIAGKAVGERVARRESERTLQNLARLFSSSS
jgi:uncharacterized protein YndB with AHSA1/START domain